MKIEINKSLKSFNTFGVEAICDYYASIKDINDLRSLVQTEIFRNNSYFILGGGSNVLFADNFHGLIIHVDIRGISNIESTGDYVILETGAGEDWTEFVKTCVESNYYGIENLAMIPGKAGAAPVQNIGAYGAEQKDIFYSLTGYDLQKDEEQILTPADCGFSYRSSIFKEELKGKFIITSVRYKLGKRKNINLSYKELEREIENANIEEVSQGLVFESVCRLRTSKLPDPRETGNAGSFFKNAIVSSEKYHVLREKFPEAPSYRVESNYKIPAGWLIEQCGWKGKKRGKLGVYEKHALIIVNYGGAKGSDILKLSQDIQSSVHDKFGIRLEPEVQIINNT